VIEIAPGQRLVLGQHVHGFHQIGVEALAVAWIARACSRAERRLV
jgi:hypothetical protein